MPQEFHHPYNFIPVTGKVNGHTTPKTEYCQVKAGQTPARHDLWLKDHYAGRVICRLHLETPLVLGNQHEGNPPALVKPYERDGRPAIPGNSLRGMIGSIAEALSQSSLRVLNDRPYSVREPIGSGRSAIGLLLKSTAPDREFDILPLTIPVLPTQDTQDASYQLNCLWQKVFEVKGGGTAPLAECLPAYIGAYSFNGIRLDYQTGSFLDTEKPRSYSLTTPEVYYAKLAGTPKGLTVGSPISVRSAGLKETDRTNKRGNTTYTLIGQQLVSGPDPILSEAEWIKRGKPQGYNKGILRVLGIDGREMDLPGRKNHELFIPYPPSKNRKRIPVLKQAVDEFYALAQERYTQDRNLPYALKGCSDWTLQEGQLVYFGVKEEVGGKPAVSEISISAIWRKGVKGSAWEFFQQIDPDLDLVPWNPDRKRLTPAELLFGVVEHREREQEEETEELGETEIAQDASVEAQDELPPARALASRVRFHDALPLPGQQVGILEHPVTLKILSSPKPPCPAMYFHPRNGSQGIFIRKTDLSIDSHYPNGRKVYLHHPQASISAGHWESAIPVENDDQKLRCTPLDAGKDFFFHVDFDNLTKAELTLLLTSLCPDNEFHHRLGLGKSLGLGSVRVDIEGVYLIYRHQRYGQTALDEPRYHSVWVPASLAQTPVWKPLYEDEAAEIGKALPSDLSQAEFYDGSLIDSDTLARLRTVGNRANLKPGVPVSPPLCDNQLTPPAAQERETFKWFVENDKSGRQALKPIPTNRMLQVLQTYATPAAPTDRRRGPQRHPPRRR